MKQQLKILILKNLPGDIEFMSKLPGNTEISFTSLFVETKKKFSEALQKFVPDIILALEPVSDFTSAEALKIYNRQGLTQPFILITETNSVEAASRFIKEGAWDYILKDDIARLPSSIAAGLKAHKRQSKKILAETRLKGQLPQRFSEKPLPGIPGNAKIPDALKEKEAQTQLQKNFELTLANEKLMKSAEILAHFGSWQLNLENHTLSCSEGMCRIYGYEPLHCKLSLEIFFTHVHPDDLAKIQSHLDTPGGLGSKQLDYRIIDKNGLLKYICAGYIVDYHTSGAPAKVRGFSMDVTERKLVELQLLESHTKYHALIENSKNAFFLTNNEGGILDVNNAACEMFGYTNEEFRKMNWSNILENNDPRFVVAAQYLKKTGNAKGEVNGIKKSGEKFMLEFTSTVFLGTQGEKRISSLMSDITLRKHQEETFIKSNERYTHVSKATFNAIWDWDVKTKELYFGDGYKELFGYDITNGTFFTWADNIYPEDKERVITSRLNKIIQNNVFTWADEYRYIRADGSVADVLDRGILLKDAKNTYRMIGAMQDVTELKNNEISIRQLNHTLEIKAKELASSNEELERFAYVASHDLQEPLRMVNGFLQLLQKKYSPQLDETAQKYIDFAVDGAGRMKTLIFDLLEYSRIGSYKEAQPNIDLNGVLSKVLKDLHSSTTEAQALINVSVLPKVYGNEFQLTRLFQNLISNGLKYRIATNPTIDVGYIERDTTWEFFVKDNGIGIDPKYFKKIFIIFQRLHGRNEYNGTGIGLAICKKIAELHGGEIWVESSGKGSEFRFTISKIPKQGAVYGDHSDDILDSDVKTI